MSNQTSELKACPFCNVSAECDADGYFSVLHEAGCFFTQHYAQETIFTNRKHIKYWNTRPTTEPVDLQAKLQEARRLVEKMRNALMPIMEQAVDHQKTDDCDGPCCTCCGMCLRSDGTGHARGCLANGVLHTSWSIHLAEQWLKENQ